jgi:transcriptional regulator PpsR
VKSFKAPRKALTGLSAEAVAGLVTAATDLALVLDRRGVIRDIATNSEDLADSVLEQWLGRALLDVVTSDSQSKVQRLLDTAQAAQLGVPSPARQVNHPLPGGQTLPVQYQMQRVDDEGRLVVLGRDLRSMADMQQQLVAVEQSLERDYSRLRAAETRFRLLLQSTTDPFFVIDLASQKVTEVNAAAADFFGAEIKNLTGKSLQELVDGASARPVAEWLLALQTTGRARELRVRSAANKASSRKECRLHGALFRQESVSHVLIRVQVAEATKSSEQALPAGAGKQVDELFAKLPDALVVLDPAGKISFVNQSFLDLTELGSEQIARGESLDRWLGRPGVDLGVMLSNLRQHGVIRAFATTMRGELGASTEVEISATQLGQGLSPYLGFSIRNVERRRVGEARIGRSLPRSVEQLTELVGRVSLKELVRETTDVIERLCIEAALELTQDNRASAAEMLGLSRQSLYVKLRRYGLGELESD